MDSGAPAQDFRNLYRHGFARVAACTLPVSAADPARNAEAIVEQVRLRHEEGVAVALFPELSVSGYSVEDLFLQDVLLDEVDRAIVTIASATRGLMPLVVVGAPLRSGSRVYNCAVAIKGGEVLGVAPKSYLPTYREFYERRWYAPGDDQVGEDIRVGELEAPFGPDLLFEALDVPGLVVHAEVCEDVWVPIPPSAGAALAGATVLLNLSGSPITIARAEDRKDLCQSQSLRCLAAYAYAAAGMGESTNDVSWDGQTMIYEGGSLLAETERFPDGPRRSVADVDLDRLRQDRLRQGTFDDNRRTYDPRFRVVHFELDPPAADIGLRRTLDRFPFVPDDPDRLAQDCYEAFNIQVSGLVQRMQAIWLHTWATRWRRRRSPSAACAAGSARRASSLLRSARWSRATPARSWLSVFMATSHPPWSGPSSAAAGTRTSLKNSSLKATSPVMVRSGRASTPGLRRSTSRQLIPRCLGASGSVRA